MKYVNLSSSLYITGGKNRKPWFSKKLTKLDDSLWSYYYGLMTIKAREFKVKCLRLMDRVKETHESITITKRGVPVAKLVPLEEEKQKKFFGRLGGCVTFEKDLITPVGETWDAAEEDNGYG